MTAKQETTAGDAVLAENLEFYRAFSTGDIAAMDQLWARSAPVSCIHPGWTALHGRDAVMTSWRDILTNPAAPQVLCYDERATVYGEVALVTCEEELSGGTTVATNIFIREHGLWRLVHHQASPLIMRQPSAPRRARGGATLQ
jgi:hypothetical protein